LGLCRNNNGFVFTLQLLQLLCDVRNPSGVIIAALKLAIWLCPNHSSAQAPWAVPTQIE
jgi:hypothetical protein